MSRESWHYCPVCGENFLDETPNEISPDHRYSVECDTCGTQIQIKTVYEHHKHTEPGFLPEEENDPQ